MSHQQPNRWKGFVLGALGGVAGVLAMSAYWQAASALAGEDPREASKENNTRQPLDSISLIGNHHQEGESSTAAMGRIAYRLVTGQEPQSEETKTTLSYLVHWGISMGMSGVYGALQGPAEVPDIQGGLALGVGLWLFGDELAMPLLGLTDGPTAYPAALHAHGLGAHLAYGLACSTTTQVLHQLV
jgi:hypothetical protein